MSNPIASMIVTADLAPAIQAVYLLNFIKEVTAIDFEIYDKYGDKEVLPANQYGDSSVTGDTGGDAGRTAGLYTGTSDGFKLTGWDDVGYFMNYGETVDGENDADYATDGGLDYNFSDFEIAEGTGYANGTDYRAHDKALTNKFYVNVPIVRFGATNQYDTLGYNLIPSKDTEQLMKQFGKQAKVVQTQYIRSTLVNLATQSPTITITAGVSDVDIVGYLNSAKQKLKLKGAEMFTGDVKASDGVGTVPVRAGFIAIISTQMENLIQGLDGFVHRTQYGTQAGVLPNEFGMIPETEIRFVTNDVLVRQSGTSAVGIVDVFAGGELTTYNMLIMAKNAYTIASLEGENRYKLYIDGTGKGDDTLRLNKNCGWKSMLGCAVQRPAWILNAPIVIA